MEQWKIVRSSTVLGTSSGCCLSVINASGRKEQETRPQHTKHMLIIRAENYSDISAHMAGFVDQFCLAAGHSLCITVRKLHFAVEASRHRLLDFPFACNS